MSKQIFISYRREGGEFLGKILYDELSKNGYSVFYDVESLRSGKFNEQLYKRIEECEYFIILLTPNCLDRCKNQNDWVRLEYEHAEKCGKNIIPILTRGFEFPENLPESMQDLPFYQGVEATAGGMEYVIKRLQNYMSAKPFDKTKDIFGRPLKEAYPGCFWLGMSAKEEEEACDKYWAMVRHIDNDIFNKK